jgi:hypothetical protein
MKAQAATQETIQTTPSRCDSGPDCPCEFCVSLRAKHGEGRSEKDIEKQLAEDSLRSCSGSVTESYRDPGHHFQSNFVAARVRRRKLKATRTTYPAFAPIVCRLRSG